ncbi:MAG: bifunctional methionine sulfoxide reductase B/A protein [Spirochaetia bacterium]
MIRFFTVSLLILIFAVSCSNGGEIIISTEQAISLQRLNQRLTRPQFRTIEQGQTEIAYSGEYYDNFEPGYYTCARCGQPLFNAESQFSSGTGWPSFDRAIEGSVTGQPDGFHTEILCSSCNGHLGHVFEGEGFTETDLRYCINSTALRFIPETGETGRAYFAGGCFWGVEFFLQEAEGVIETSVGFTGGDVPFATSRTVRMRETGHYEAVEVLYDPEIITYSEIVRLFFNIHDPEQRDGQGPDIGFKYQSAVFYENRSQRETVEELLEQLRDAGYDPATRVLPAGPFYPAGEAHQDYYAQRESLPYCHEYTERLQ